MQAVNHAVILNATPPPRNLPRLLARIRYENRRTLVLLSGPVRLR